MMHYTDIHLNFFNLTLQFCLCDCRVFLGADLVIFTIICYHLLDFKHLIFLDRIKHGDSSSEIKEIHHLKTARAVLLVIKEAVQFP